MRIRKLNSGDTGRVFEAFQSAAVREGESKPSGFYEYPLTEEDIRSRINPRFSLGLFDRKKLVSYILAYPLAEGDNKDPVIASVDSEPGAVYFDQLYLRPGEPLYTAGRLVDTWTNLAFNSDVPGVITAIPQYPWKNVPSTRLAISRGCRRIGSVREGETKLAIFAKPLWRVGEVGELNARVRTEND